MKAKPSQTPPEAKSEPKSSGNFIDTFVKRMFGRVLVFADFLANYADPKFVAEIDLRKIKPAPTHYIGKDGSERIVDLVFQCPLKSGRGSLMAVIVFEHQSRTLKQIPLKLHKYISAIWDAELKEGKKVLSAPYFIVLRTAKKPHRGRYPTIADWLPEGRDGKPLGKTVEIDYDVVDLPAWDFKKLVGGPVVRLALGILKKMIEDDGEELPEAFLPLLEIADQEEKVELTADAIQFAAKAFAAHNRRLDEALMSKALKPIFKDWEKTMIKTLFEEKFDEGVAVGKTETVLAFLRAKFHRIPKEVEKAIRQMTDPVALDSLTANIVNCASMDDFTKSLK